MGVSTRKRTISLLVLATLLILSGGIAVWRYAEYHALSRNQISGRGLQSPPSGWKSVPGSLIGESARQNEQVSSLGVSVPDRYAGLPILEKREDPSPVQPRLRWTETLLVRSAGFKYPLLRVVNQWRQGKKEPVRVRQQAMVADHVVVKLRAGTRIETLLQRFPLLDPKVRRRLPASGLWLLSFEEPDLDTVPRAILEIGKARDLIMTVQADFVSHAALAPNDGSFGSLWGLHNIGQSGGTVDVDIDAPEAWNLTTGSRSVLVAIIDTGIDQTHPDLAANLWVNPRETPGNNLDDDGNGYIDDVRGWDFVNSDNSPMDDHGHGTHCAGTIGAVGNNAMGVAGVNWQVSLVGLKFLDASGNGTNSDATEAIYYATSIGVDLSSNSWGGGGYDGLMKAAIDQAGTQGALFICAAGNNGSDNDSSPNYPSNYASENLIAVAAITRNGALATFSNYGAGTVDLAAPGQDIYSTFPGGGYGMSSGTSMAAPHVSGTCALLKSYRPTLTTQEVRSLLLASAAPLLALTGKCVTGGLLNARAALDAANDLSLSPSDVYAASGQAGGPPVAPANREYTLTNRSSLTANWTSTSTQPWLTLSPSSGTLAAGQSIIVTASISQSANSLPLGSHTASFTITNPVTLRVHKRSVSVSITPQTIASFEMDSETGWSLEGQWEFGAPLGAGGTSFGGPDPASGATGVNVIGTNLGGDYAPVVAGPFFATTPAINVQHFKDVRLEFQSWLNCDYQPYCNFAVQVSTNGQEWSTLLTNTVNESVQFSWEHVDADLSQLLTGSSTAWLRFGYQTTAGVYPYSGWNLDDIKLLGTPASRLVLTLSQYELSEGGASALATIEIVPPPTSPLTLNFSTDPGSQASFSEHSVSVGAGESVATVSLQAVNDSLLDGSQTAQVLVQAPGYQTGTASIVVHDNEAAALTVQLPQSVTEGSTPVLGSITLPAPADLPIRIALRSSDVSELNVPAFVTLPAQSNSVSFSVSVVDDTEIDGPQAASVSASVSGWVAGQATSTVNDNESNILQIQMPSYVLETAGTLQNAGKVILAGTLTTDLVVNFESGDESCLIVPTQVTVSAGYTEATFDLTAIASPDRTGHRAIEITASSPGFVSGARTVIVFDEQSVAEPINPSPVHLAATVPPDADLSWSVLPGGGDPPEVYEVYLGTQPQLSAGDWLGTTVSPFWPLPHMTRGTTYYWKVVSRSGSETASSPTWQFSVPPVGPLHHFVWSQVPSSTLVETPFNATLSAVDEYGDVIDFNGTATLTTKSGGSSILVSEIGYDTEDGIEITNVGVESVDLSGWQTTLYDELTWPSPRLTFQIPAGTVLQPGQVLQVVEEGVAPGSAPLFRLGESIYWTQVSRIGVLMRNASGHVVDFVTVGGPASQLSLPVPIPSSEWAGAPIPVSNATGVSYTRTAEEDHHTAADWSETEPTLGSVNAGLTLPFANAGPALPVHPDHADFVNGIWTGPVKIRRTHPRTRLLATDASGHQGVADEMEVHSLGALSLTPLITQATEGSGIVPAVATVSLPAALAVETVVQLVSEDGSELASSSFSIPAGEITASVPLTIIDDTVIDGSQPVAYHLYVSGYEGVSGAITVHDNETAALSLFCPATAVEGSGTVLQGLVSVSAPVASAVTVSLASTQPAKASLPAAVTIPPGGTSASFSISVHDDNFVDGTRAVQLTASVSGWQSGSATLNVLDNEQRVLTLSLPLSSVEGDDILAGAGQVSVSGLAFESITVALSASPMDQYGIPTTVTIPAGQSSARFDLQPLENLVREAVEDVSITASAPTFSSAQAYTSIFDNDAASFTNSPIGNPQGLGATFHWHLTALDIDGYPLRKVQGPYTLKAIANGGEVPLSPATAGPFINGFWTVPARVLSLATNVRLHLTTPTASAVSNAFNIDGGPRITVTPNSVSASTPQGTVLQRTVTVSNSGSGSLHWAVQGSTGIIASFSPVYQGVQSLDDVPNTGPLYSSPVLPSSETEDALASHDELNDVLAALTVGATKVSALVPFRHDFTGGDSSGSIPDGGGNAFDHGNVLRTDLITDDQAIPYSNNVITANAALGSNGRYFTQKSQGLFVFAADLNGVDEFLIQGGLGADSYGSVDGLILSIARHRRHWKGYAKRVFNTGTPSVTHLVLVPDAGPTRHRFAQDSNFDEHQITGLSAVNRLYYLLFTSDGGQAVSDQALLAIAESFLSIVDGPAWVSASPTSGVLASNSSQSVTLSLNATDLPAGNSSGAAVFVSNDALASAQPVGLSLTVTAAPPPPTPLMASEPLFTGGLSNQVSWSHSGNNSEYQVQHDTVGAFTNPISSAWQSANSYLASPLQEGLTYHFRVRARNPAGGGASASNSDWSAPVSSTQDATPPQLSFSLASGGFTGQRNYPVEALASDAAGLTSVSFTPVVGGETIQALSAPPFGRWTATLANLQVGPQTFRVLASDGAVPPNTSEQLWTISFLDPEAQVANGQISSVLAAAFNVPTDDPSSMDQLTPRTGTAVAATDGKTYLTITYRRRLVRAGFTYIVETSGNLLQWSDASASIIEETAAPVGDGIMEDCSVRLGPPIEDAGTRFVRVRVRLD